MIIVSMLIAQRYSILYFYGLCNHKSNQYFSITSKYTKNSDTYL